MSCGGARVECSHTHCVCCLKPPPAGSAEGSTTRASLPEDGARAPWRWWTCSADTGMGCAKGPPVHPGPIAAEWELWRGSMVATGGLDQEGQVITAVGTVSARCAVPLSL